MTEDSLLTAGVDEAGRGSFFGPVFAGCVIWDNDISHKWLKDSKKLTKSQRDFMQDYIIDNCVAYGIGKSDHEHINKYGIVSATMSAMHESIDNMNIEVDKLLIDGDYFNYYKNIKHECYIKGDSIFPCISAASILAKTFHDDFIKEVCNNNETLNINYDLSNNMGYGTKNHINGILKFGMIDGHRKQFISKYI